MKQKIFFIVKAFIKLLTPYSLRRSLTAKRALQHKHMDCIFNLWKYKTITANNGINDCMNYVRQMERIFNKSHINTNCFYIYPLDTHIQRIPPKGKSTICSITPDFGKIINSDLEKIKLDLCKCKNKEFSITETTLIDSIYLLRDRIVSAIEKQNTQRKQFFLDYLPRMLDSKPSSFDEALQKILFYNALFWQANHWHIGLGRLDKILYPYYQEDLNKGTIDRNKAKSMIYEFCRILNADMNFKSMGLLGDTGQYILLGGIDENGENVQNEISELFLEVVGEMHLPDPKIILRVNANTNSTVWQKSISCILTGCGSPLLMNESVIMNNMEKFGYLPEHVSQVGTSACWEPLIIGKSFDQNNPLPSVVAVKCVNEAVLKDNEYGDFESLYNVYKQLLSNAICSTAHDIDFDCSPLFSLFFDDCITRGKDYTKGGAIYANHGMQIVSFPNAINSLLNIKRYVFDERLFTLADCRDAILNDYAGHEDMLRVFEHNQTCFGSPEEEALALTNDLLDSVSQTVNNVKVNGEKIKIGISSPNYIGCASIVPATLDGRKAKMPFAVHVSPISECVGIKEIIDFASKLRYSGNIINGNVVDFILPVAFAKYPDKLETILRDAIHNGVFELQLNVLNAEILKDAKIHPENHKDLIVRVWGFSAYFNDLPESYKDNLIKRAEMYGR